MESGSFLETQKVNFIIHSGYQYDGNSTKVLKWVKTIGKWKHSQRQKHIEQIKKIWRIETVSGLSARTSDSDKVSDSNIKFIKTGWETMMTQCSSSV